MHELAPAAAQPRVAITHLVEHERIEKALKALRELPVMGGIAHRYGWSATLLRVIFVVVSIASAAFPGILVYLILWLLMPNEQD